MFQKKNSDHSSSSSSSRVIKETVTIEGGTILTERTTFTSSGTNEDFETAFKRMGFDPNIKTDGVTKKITYTSAPEQEKSKPKADSKKSWTEKLGLKSKDTSASSNESSKCMDSTQFEKDCLKAHNDYRSKHGVAPLKISKQLSSYSKEWADNLASIDKMKHRTEGKYGENIFAKWSSNSNHVVSGHEAVDAWYNEIKDHTFGKEPTTSGTGHFTQVIWKTSTTMGVGWARSKTGNVYVVANYDPPGNFIGTYTQNVPPPKK